MSRSEPAAVKNRSSKIAEKSKATYRRNRVAVYAPVVLLFASALTPTRERVLIHSRQLPTNQLPSTGLYSRLRGGVRATYDSSVYVFAETSDLAILDRPNVRPG